jgi:hypothetical protein
MSQRKISINFYSSVLNDIKIPNDFESLKNTIFLEFCLNDFDIKEIEIFYYENDKKKIINNDEDYKFFIDNNNNKNLNVKEKSFLIKNLPKKNFTEKITNFVSNEIEIAMNNIKNLILNEENRNDEINLNLNVHYDFSCDECKKNFICGYVFKCLFDDVNLCYKCSLNHKHPMFKIK